MLAGSEEFGPWADPPADAATGPTSRTAASPGARAGEHADPRRLRTGQGCAAWCPRWRASGGSRRAGRRPPGRALPRAASGRWTGGGTLPAPRRPGAPGALPPSWAGARLSTESISPRRTWGSAGLSGTTILSAANDAMTSRTRWNSSDPPNDWGSVSGDRPSFNLMLGMNKVPQGPQCGPPFRTKVRTADSTILRRDILPGGRWNEIRGRLGNLDAPWPAHRAPQMLAGQDQHHERRDDRADQPVERRQPSAGRRDRGRLGRRDRRPSADDQGGQARTVPSLVLHALEERPDEPDRVARPGRSVPASSRGRRDRAGYRPESPPRLPPGGKGPERPLAEPPDDPALDLHATPSVRLGVVPKLAEPDGHGRIVSPCRSRRRGTRPDRRWSAACRWLPPGPFPEPGSQ